MKYVNYLKQGHSLKKLVSQFEKKILLEVLDHFKGNITKTSELCQLTRTGVYKKMQLYDIIDQHPKDDQISAP